MMKKKLFNLLAAVLAATLSATGCSMSTSTNSRETDTVAEETALSDASSNAANELHVQLAGTPETIDPALNSTVDGSNMIIHLSEGLLKTDKDDNIVGGIAKSWKVSEDGLSYTFHLRDRLKWSDGTKITADDIVYSWKRIADPMMLSPYAHDLLCYVEGWGEASDAQNPNADALAVSAPNSKTFVVQLSTPCPFFDKICAFPTLVPVPKASVESGDDWTTNPATCITDGAYRLTEYTPGDAIVMEKNEYYWDAKNISFDKITWHLIEDDNDAYSAYLDETLDFCFGIPTDQISILNKNKEFHKEAVAGTYYLDFNIDKKPFDDVRVRKALSLAIDRDYIANTVMPGVYSPAKNLIGPGVSNSKDGSSFEKITKKKYGNRFRKADYSANLDEAKRLLSEAGYPDGEGFPTIRYATNDSGFNSAVAEYLQSVWKNELGIDMEIDVREWEIFSADRRAGNFDVAMDGWGFDWDDPSNMINIFETASGNNDGHFSSEQFDRLADEAKRTTDRKERFDKLHEAEQVILDEAACAPIAYYTDFWLQKSNLKNTWRSPFGYFYFMYGEMK